MTETVFTGHITARQYVDEDEVPAGITRHVITPTNSNVWAVLAEDMFGLHIAIEQDTTKPDHVLMTRGSKWLHPATAVRVGMQYVKDGCSVGNDTTLDRPTCLLAGHNPKIVTFDRVMRMDELASDAIARSASDAVVLSDKYSRVVDPLVYSLIFLYVSKE